MAAHSRGPDRHRHDAAAVVVRRQRPVHVLSAAATCCGDVMVVLAFVSRDHGPYIVRRSLDVLPHRASSICALIVAPVDQQKQENQWLVPQLSLLFSVFLSPFNLNICLRCEI